MARRFLLGFLLLVTLWACGGPAQQPPAGGSPAADQTPPIATAAAGGPTAVAVQPTAIPTAAIDPTATPAQPTETPAPTPLTSDPRTGRPALARGTLTQRPLIAMIDNHPDAYPQTGLDEAAVVFEALAEFGVTRYMALYTPEIKPIEGNIGPVRSARIYFVQWAMGFRAVYAHAGGSPAGLERLAEDDNTLVINIDFVALEDEGTFDFSHRARERLAPHNLYTTQVEVGRYLQQRVPDRVAADVSEVGYLFAADAPAQGAANPATSINYYFLYPEDPAGWSYDPAGNEYYRLRRNQPHVDAVSGQQLSFKSVTVMEVSEAPIPDDPKGRIDQDVIGEGSAVVFANGGQTAATWRKESEDSPLRFYDDQGQEIVFPAGPMWIAAIPSLSHLTVQ